MVRNFRIRTLKLGNPQELGFGQFLVMGDRIESAFLLTMFPFVTSAFFSTFKAVFFDTTLALTAA
jgi:hypothetical protein